MTNKLDLSASTLAELHSLPDDVLLTTAEAAMFLRVAPRSLAWYRCHRMGPEFIKIGGKTVRYRVGALRDYASLLQPGIGRPKKEA